jgi:hypothetical protein
MGVYPCRGCGALFISVNMTQETHSPKCPYLECARCGHSQAAHDGHTHKIGTDPPTHCSQGCGCEAFLVGK